MSKQAPLRKALIEARWNICLAVVGTFLSISWGMPSFITWAAGLVCGLCVTEVLLRTAMHEHEEQQ